MQHYFVVSMANSFSHAIFCIYVVETYFSKENALALKKNRQKNWEQEMRKYLTKDLPKDTQDNKVSEKTWAPDSFPLSWGLRHKFHKASEAF